MFFDDVWIDPVEVTAVQAWNQKKSHNGIVSSKGSIIFTTGGHCFHVGSPLTQVVSVVESAKREDIPQRLTDMKE